MAFKRGRIHLANFNPAKGTEPVKVRPCLIIQSDYLNEVEHPSTAVIPLTTRLVEDAAPLRLRIPARDRLQADSDIMIDQPRTIDNRRITDPPLTALTATELAEVEEYVRIVLGLEG